MASRKIRTHKSLTCLTILCLLIATTAAASDSRKSIRSALEKPLVRGGIVFKNYCVLCHGEKGDGRSRASKLYGEMQLRIRNRNNTHYESVIRRGGTAGGLSPFMPPWNDELSEEQISDVIAYLGVVANDIKRGEVVYKTNCILCHGIKGDGKGRAAQLFDPPPADLTRSDKNDDYKAMIIRLGGKAMGRSEVMPSWQSQLTDQEIKDVVRYLDSILTNDNLASKN